MTRNKLIFSVSLIATLFILSSLMENRHDETVSRQPDLTLSAPRSDCPTMSDLMIRNPDASIEEIEKVEHCQKELARRSGRDQANAGFPGNTTVRPRGALAHYELNHGQNTFTVYADRIEAIEPYGRDKNTVIPFSRVTRVQEGQDIPGSVVIDYTTEGGVSFAYTLMLLRNDDMIKKDGARDIDRLIALLRQQQIASK